MTIELTAEMQDLIDSRVSPGRSASTNEVLLEALLMSQERDRREAEELARFQFLLQQSIDEADRGDFVDADDMFAELRERGRMMGKAAA